ncbi:MAG: RluA family pseudouridine synthase [Neisseriaceae bacterium]
MSNFSKNQVNFYTVTEKDDNQRLDNLLCKILKNVPKSYIFRIIRSGEVRINKKRVMVNSKVMLNDIIRIPPVEVKDPKKSDINIPKAQFDILFEDEYFLIINKPSKIACHGGSGISFGVIEQLRNTYTQSKFLELAHRIDRDTSGILVLAKKRQALVKFQELIRSSKLKKTYLALTIGEMENISQTVKVPLYKYITKDGERRVKVDKELGQFSHTIFNILTRYENYTLVKAEIKTGRTHQIRVHLQHIGYPIAMDDKYGVFEINRKLTKLGLKRMFLHAFELEFIHPITDKAVKIQANLPQELQKFVQTLKAKQK